MEPLYIKEAIQSINKHHDKLLSNIDLTQKTNHRYRMDKSRRQIHARNPHQRMKYRYELNFQTKSILHNNQFISFDKRSPLITVDHFLSKIENLPFPKQKWFLDSKEEYPKLSVKQLTQ